MLNSDELGAKGEKRFAELCLDAQLICNASDRDRAGWDFIVEFPFSFTRLSLDRRHTPPSCHVQVKTVWEGAKDVKLRLSSAERLSKELKPSFICTLIFSKDLMLKRIRLTHIRGEALALILKRLRSESAKTSKLSGKFITLSIEKYGIDVPINGAGLKNALELLIGSQMPKYLQNKADELENLGFREPRMSVKLDLPGYDRKQMADFFLGTQDFQGRITAFETRFDIALPVSDAEEGTFRITPEVHTCIFTARGASKNEVQFAATALFTPPIDDNYIKCIVNSNLFKITSDNSDHFTINLPDHNECTATVDEWIAFYNFIEMMNAGQVSCELKGLEKKYGVWKIRGNAFKKYTDRIANALRTLHQLSDILKKTGGDATHFSIEVIRNYKEILIAHEIVCDAISRARIKFAADGLINLGPDVLFASHIPLGPLDVLYCAQLTVSTSIEDSRQSWKSEKVRPLGGKVGRYPEDYDAFVEETRLASGIGYVVHGRDLRIQSPLQDDPHP